MKDAEKICLACGFCFTFCFAVSYVDTAIFFGGIMEERVAVIGIIVENPDAVGHLNAILHEYGDYIIGRMGIPYKKRAINVISIAVDAPQPIISALSGKIGRISGVSAKTAYSGVVGNG